MAGLPDDLRSLADTILRAERPAAHRGQVLNRAADELDARAARIQRLEMVIKRAMTVVSAADAPDDEWVQDLEMKVDPSVPPGEVHVRHGDKTVGKIVNITPDHPVYPYRFNLPAPIRIDLPGGGTIWISR